ncbi:hypothetical protein CGRA01v4_07303 [Colletotrichum graminicola]|nr:hypothetical protein CGRA01v4_07303 [Colletotrichum graminicola]
MPSLCPSSAFFSTKGHMRSRDTAGPKRFPRVSYTYIYASWDQARVQTRRMHCHHQLVFPAFLITQNPQAWMLGLRIRSSLPRKAVPTRSDPPSLVPAVPQLSHGFCGSELPLLPSGKRIILA